MAKQSFGFFRGVFHGLDILRRLIINLLFISIIIIIAVAIMTAKPPTVPKGAALVLAPEGIIVEQLDYVNPFEELAGEFSEDDRPKQTLLKDLIEALNKAKTDDNIKALVIDTRELLHADLSKLQSLNKAIANFKESEKKVLAIGDFYGQTHYHLALQADEIILNPYGGVFLEGYGRHRTYFREALDKLEITYHVFRVGTYKSAIEPYLRNDMSPAAKESNLEWLNTLWSNYKNDVAAKRDISATQLDDYVNQFAEQLKTTNGDLGQLALNSKLVDSLMTRNQWRERMIELVGHDEDKKSYNGIYHDDYLAIVKPPLDMSAGNNNNKIAVVVAKGVIMDGDQPAGTIGGESTAATIRKAREDDNIKAIVLRVDSPGGSAFASELIRLELTKAQQDGKPVVVSMGSMAASGGYWISATADEIWATPTTITGSIGIYGLFPTIEKPLAKLGIHRDGVGTTNLAGALDVTQTLKPETAAIFQTIIENGYQRFLELVAEGRNMTVEQVDSIAQGRVWSGEKALSLGLVDKLGELDDAIAAAATKAGLESYDVDYVEKELSPKELLFKELTSQAKTWLVDTTRTTHTTPSMAQRLLLDLKQQWHELNQLNDPQGVYAHCFCTIE